MISKEQAQRLRELMMAEWGASGAYDGAQGLPQSVQMGLARDIEKCSIALQDYIDSLTAPEDE